MAPLTGGTPLTWMEIVPLLNEQKAKGIEQFLELYRHNKDRKDDAFRWGEEVEYTVLTFDQPRQKVRVFLCAQRILQRLKDAEKENLSSRAVWSPESSGYMIEAMPAAPYGGPEPLFKSVETNMLARRELLMRKMLEEDESLMSISFPALGTLDFLLIDIITTNVL